MVAFSVPIILGELLQNLYNSVDALVVGNLIDENALAAVSVCGLIATLVINFFNGMSMGSNVVVSRAFGEKNKEQLDKAISVTFTFSTLMGVLLSGIGIICAPLLLRVAGVLPEYYEDALVYLRIYLAGLMFTVIYNNGAGILRAIGDTKTPFLILVVSCSFNIILDLVMVALFAWGIAGVGIATIVSQSISTILVYRILSKREKHQCIDFNRMIHSGREVIHASLNIGIAAGIQSAMIGFSNLFIAQYMNLFDTASVAGIGIAQRLDKFVVLPAKSFGITITTFVSQNLGAQQYERVREGKNKCLALGISVTLLLSWMVLGFSKECVSLFNRNPTVVSVGVSMMHILIPMFFTVAIREIYTGFLRGYGKTKIPTILNLTGMVGARQLYLAIAMRKSVKIEYIYYCYPIAWLASVVLLLIYYKMMKKNLS